MQLRDEVRSTLEQVIQGFLQEKGDPTRARWAVERLLRWNRYAELVDWTLEQMKDEKSHVRARIAIIGASDDVKKELLKELCADGYVALAKALADETEGGMTVEHVRALGAAYAIGKMSQHRDTEMDISLMFQKLVGPRGPDEFRGMIAQLA